MYGYGSGGVLVVTESLIYGCFASGVVGNTLIMRASKAKRSS